MPVSSSAVDSDGALIDEAAPGFVDRYLPALLNQAVHCITAGFADVVHERGLSVLEWRVLTTLADGDDVPVGTLARRAITKQPTLTRLLDRMADQGHVVRVDDRDDRRQKRVRITPAGRALVDDLMRLAEAHQEQVLATFGAARRQALEALLRALIEEAGPGPS